LFLATQRPPKDFLFPRRPYHPRMQPEGFLIPSEYSLRASEVGTDLRAVRRCGIAR